MKKRLISLLLAVLMLASLLPTAAFAEEPAAEAEEHVHEYVFVEEVPATLEAEGVKEHYICSGCDCLFVLEEEEYIEVTAEELVIPSLEAGSEEEPALEEQPAAEEEPASEDEPAEELPDADILAADVATGSCGDSLTWTISGNYTLTVSGTGNMYDYNAEILNGIGDVTDAPWREYSQRIKAVVIGPGVTNVGANAFRGCRNVLSVSIGNDVETVKAYAFYECEYNKTLTLGSGIKIIEEYAFASMNTGAITLPAGLETLGEAAFGRNTCAKTVNLNSALKEIGREAFTHNVKLTAIDIPDSVETIGEAAFEGCERLQSIKIGAGVEVLETELFDGCKALKDITLTSTVNTIYCDFQDCTKLTDVYFLGSEDEWNNISGADEEPLCSVNKTFTHMADGSDGDLYWSIDNNGVFTLSGQGRMGDWPNDDDLCCAPWADYYDRITSVVIGSGITYIGVSAFEGCLNITKLTLGKDVKEIGNYAFADCEKLASIDFSETLEEIGEFSFYGCNSLISLTLPDSVKTLGKWCFAACVNFREITMNGVKNIATQALAFNDNLRCVHLGESLNYVQQGTFIGSEYITDVYYAGTSVEWEAIGDTGLDGLPSSATLHFAKQLSGELELDFIWSISDDYTLTISGGGTMPSFNEGEAPWYVQADPAKIESVVLCGVTGLGDYAFYGMPNIKSVTFIGTENMWQLIAAMSYGIGNEDLFRGEISIVTPIVSMDKEYLAVKAGEDFRLTATTNVEDFADLIAWYSDDTAVAEVSDSGLVTAVAPGTTYIHVGFDGSYSTITGVCEAVCRIDVTPDEVYLSLKGVTAETTKLTAKLYSTSYTELGLKLELDSASTLSVAQALAGGWAITGACFTDSTAANCFSLKVIDDSRVQLVPNTSIAAKQFPGKISSAVRVTIKEPSGGNTFTYDTAKITVSVDKKLPSIKAKAVTLNSYYGSAMGKIEFTGGTVTEITASEALPAWLELAGDEYIATVSEYRSQIPASGTAKVKLNVKVQGWNYLFPVELSVKTKLSKPSVTAKVTGIIDTSVPGSSVVVTATVKNPNCNRGIADNFIEACYVLNGKGELVASMTSPAEGDFFTITENNGVFTVKQKAETVEAGNYTLMVDIDTDALPHPLDSNLVGATMKASFKVKTTASAKLKPGVTVKATGAIDVIRPLNTSVTVSATFKDYASFTQTGDNFLEYWSLYVLDGKTWTKIDTESLQCPLQVKETENGITISSRILNRLDASKKYAVKFCYTDDTLNKTFESGYVKFTVKQGKSKVTADKSAITFYRTDRYSSALINLAAEKGVDIAKVELSAKDQALVQLDSLNSDNTSLRLSFNGGAVTFTKTRTVTLNVWFKGSTNVKPDATVKIKINIA